MPEQCHVNQFASSDGYRLHYRRWDAVSQPPKSFVVALHGIQSHSGWYEHSCAELQQHGHSIWFLDRRGSGLNQEKRGDTPHEDRLVNDVVQFLNHVRHIRDTTAPQAPVVLMGISWGGKLAAVTAARRPELVDAISLLYPGICARVRPNFWQRFQLRLAERLDIRQKRVAIPLDDPAMFTGEPQWQQFIRDDPLALHRVTVGFLLANRSLDEQVSATAGKLRCPLLLMLAGKDRIVDNAATEAFFERIASMNGRKIVYPDAQHTLEFESNRDDFVRDLIAWLDDAANTFCHSS